MRLFAGLLLMLLTGCASLPPPQHRDNLCTMFQERSDWFNSAHHASSTWGIPVPVLMATVEHESGFQSRVRPKRTYYLGFIPGPRASDAFGYAQARNQAWRDYRHSTGHHLAERDDFADAVDFIGWYDHGSVLRDHIEPDDAYHLYLAYHEGQGGYARGSWRDKAWLQRTAHGVAELAHRYEVQYQSCVKELEAPHWWSWF